MTGTLQTIDGRPAVRLERRLPHAVDRVWRAVTEPDELRRWFVAPVPWTPAEGETFDAYGETVVVTDVRAPERLAWTWGDQAFSFELSAEAGATVLVFTHVFGDRSPQAQHALGWESYFMRLDFVLAGSELSEEEAHSSRRFTLEDGPTLRLERRFTQSPERVFRALSDPGERRHWFPPDAPLEVTESDPPRLLAGTWFGDELRFELTPDRDGGGCVLVFTHAFEERDTAARTAAGWDRCIARLERLLSSAPVGEAEALELWLEVHDAYAKAFGVDPALGREAYEQHPLT